MTMINANLQKIEEEFRSTRTYNIERLQADRIELHKKVDLLQVEVDGIFNHLQNYRKNNGNDEAVDISARDNFLATQVRRKVDDKLNEEDLMKLSKKELITMIMKK